jgi:hypothetical protein
MRETSNISVIYGQVHMSFDCHPLLTRTKYSTCTWSPVVGNHQKCAFKSHILAEGGLLIPFFQSLYPLKPTNFHASFENERLAGNLFVISLTCSLTNQTRAPVGRKA